VAQRDADKSAKSGETARSAESTGGTKSAKNRTKEKILSFVGGTVVFSVVLGVVVSKDERIRLEIQKQARRFLETSKGVLGQYENLADTIKKFTGQAKNAKETSNLMKGKRALLGDEYERQWAVVEKMATR